MRSRPPEAQALDRTQTSIQRTQNLEGEEHVIWKDPGEEVHAMSREK